MENWPKDKKIILFDGVCNLCNQAINNVIKADKKDQFRFASLDSAVGQAILTHIGIDRNNTDSMVLYEPGKAYHIKSDAALEIASALGGRYAPLVLCKVIPRILRDMLYDYVAKNRYKWYGKRDSCLIPTPELLNKFL